MSTKYVYLFHEGHKDQKDLLGGKGANLAEMTNLGLPVPPGFTITTEACNEYSRGGMQLPDGLMDQVRAALAAVEQAAGKTLGDAASPLLVSVRSGAKFSMPGMMDTVLNLGLNETTLRGLIDATRRRALRLRRLPPLHHDVLRHRARTRTQDVRPHLQ